MLQKIHRHPKVRGGHVCLIQKGGHQEIRLYQRGNGVRFFHYHALNVYMSFKDNSMILIYYQCCLSFTYEEAGLSKKITAQPSCPHIL